MSASLGAPANDSLSQTLAKFKPEDLLVVLSGLKKVSESSPAEARGMLEANQDLAYAVLQAELLMGLINDTVISEQIEYFKAQAQASSDKQTTEQTTEQKAQTVQSKPDPFAGMTSEQVAFIKQVISVTDEQLALLPPEQQEQVRSLKKQYAL